MALLYLVGIWIGDLLEVPVEILASMVFFACLSALFFHVIKVFCSTACESNSGVLWGSIYSGSELCGWFRFGALVCSLFLVGALRIAVETQGHSSNDLRFENAEGVLFSYRN